MIIVSEEETQMCADFERRMDTSLEADSAACGKSTMKICRQSRGGQQKTIESEDSHAVALKKRLVTRRNIDRIEEGSQKQCNSRERSRKHRHRSEQLMVEFPSQKVRDRESGRKTKKEPKKSLSKNDISDRTAETVDSYIHNIEKEKRKKKQLLGDFEDSFNWSQSSIVWGDEECCSYVDPSDACDVCKLSNAYAAESTGVKNEISTKSSRSSNRGGRVRSSRGSQHLDHSLSAADHRVKSIATEPSLSPLWQSFSTIKVSSKKPEP